MILFNRAHRQACLLAAIALLFSTENFSRPYTRTHSRYAGPPMTYPDGTLATGSVGTTTDPRNSRVYDAGCSKDIFGNLAVQYTDTAGPTNGLILNPETSNYASFVMFRKDSSCPAWIGYTYASTILRQFTPGGFLDGDNQPHQFAIWGWGTALGELHIHTA